MKRRRTLQLLLTAAIAAVAGALALSGVLPAKPDKAVSGPPAGHVFEPVFADEFEGSRVDDGKWLFAFYDPKTEKPGIAKRNLWNNGERQVYMDPAFLGLGIDPFTVKDGTLQIAATPLAAAQRAMVATEVSLQPPEIARTALKDVAYSSGMISSRGTFSQTYGYFEIRARWSGGKGIWPAFWLLPAKGGWPPEIDVLEAHGDKPGVTFHTLHSREKTNGTQTIRRPASDGAFHTYGVLWLADTISFYIDERLTASEPTPADMHQPMYVIANLAIGGKWPGDPDGGTRFPATMEIDYVRAWSVAGKPVSAP